jgi:hypothetical protein
MRCGVESGASPRLFYLQLGFPVSLLGKPVRQEHLFDVIHALALHVHTLNLLSGRAEDDELGWFSTNAAER